MMSKLMGMCESEMEGNETKTQRKTVGAVALRISAGKPLSTKKEN